MPENVPAKTLVRTTSCYARSFDLIPQPLAADRLVEDDHVKLQIELYRVLECTALITTLGTHQCCIRVSALSKYGMLMPGPSCLVIIIVLIFLIKLIIIGGQVGRATA